MKRVIRFSVLFFALTSLVLVSCNKDPQPGVAEIKVVDETGTFQTGIDVVLYCTQPDCVVRTEGVTNSLGVFTSEYELPVVLKVRAVRYDTTTEIIGLPPNQIEVHSIDSLCGEGFVQIENDAIVKETITILECN